MIVSAQKVSLEEAGGSGHVSHCSANTKDRTFPYPVISCTARDETQVNSHIMMSDRRATLTTNGYSMTSRVRCEDSLEFDCVKARSSTWAERHHF